MFLDYYKDKFHKHYITHVIQLTSVRYTYTAAFTDNKRVLYLEHITMSTMGTIGHYLYMSRVVRKPAFYISENKDADQLRGNSITANLICVFVFATRILQSLYFLNPKFQASSYLLWLYIPVCVAPVQKRRKPLFSQRGSYSIHSRIIERILSPYQMRIDKH